MSQVDFDSFVRWAEDKFNGNLIIKGNEVLINSIFTEDYKYHLWCNPYGGKHNREDGCYHCWKTGEKGTLVGLVARVESCDYDEAREIISGRTPFRIIEQQLEEFFNNKEKVEPEKVISKIKLPDHSFRISNMPNDSLERMEAESYLSNRKMPIDGLYFCTGGEYKNRIILPYRDEIGNLIYFNARHVGKAKLRYMGPPKSIGVGKGDVLYFYRWPKDGSKIYLCEGEFNAITLCVCGLNGVACGGKNLSDIQLGILKKHKYEVCIAFDRDPTLVETEGPGFKASLDVAKKLLAAFVPVSLVRPAQGLKDWNNMIIRFAPQILQEFIRIAEMPLDPLTVDQLGV